MDPPPRKGMPSRQDVEMVEGFSDLMGHAGALVRRLDGMIEAGFDPRSDGAARGF